MLLRSFKKTYVIKHRRSVSEFSDEELSTKEKRWIVVKIWISIGSAIWKYNFWQRAVDVKHILQSLKICLQSRWRAKEEIKFRFLIHNNANSDRKVLKKIWWEALMTRWFTKDDTLYQQCIIVSRPGEEARIIYGNRTKHDEKKFSLINDN